MRYSIQFLVGSLFLVGSTHGFTLGPGIVHWFSAHYKCLSPMQLQVVVGLFEFGSLALYPSLVAQFLSTSKQQEVLLSKTFLTQGYWQNVICSILQL